MSNKKETNKNNNNLEMENIKQEELICKDEKEEKMGNKTDEKPNEFVPSDEVEVDKLKKEDQEKEKYEEKIKELEKKLAEKNESYLRLMAEFDNYKKRIAKEYEKMVEFANEKLILELIGVRESFELALKHGEKSNDYQQLFEGIKLIYNKFDTILTANGLSWFGEKGEPFDPQLHDALMKTSHSEIEDGHIADIYERGYKLKDRIIKHAKVIVSSGKPVDNNTPVPEEQSNSSQQEGVK